MVMTGILSALFVVCVVFSLRDIWATTKHDRVVFPFFELQRNIMRFLIANAWDKKPATMSIAEFESLCGLLKAVDFTVANYNKRKTVMFNWRRIAEDLKKYRQTSDATLPVPANDEIKKFHDQFRKLLVKAVFAYTPLIRFKLLVRVFAKGYRAGKKVGERKKVEDLVNNARKIRADARRYGLITSAAT